MKRLTLCLFVLLASAVVVAVSSAPAYAVDGVVLINQNTATSGGLPGCPTGGTFPIIICQPGSYKLSGNLVVTTTANAIDITTGGVTLDLNGFAIIGPASCPIVNFNVSCTGSAGRGIFVNRPFTASSVLQSFAIRNGTVEGFLVGIEVNAVAGTHGIVEEITATGNIADGMDVAYTLVRRCDGSYNGQTGINAGYSTITENIANANNNTGIQGDGSSVIGNTANANGSRGLLMIQGLFGSNELISNGSVPFESADGATDQGNNDCGTGSPC